MLFVGGIRLRLRCRLCCRLPLAVIRLHKTRLHLLARGRFHERRQDERGAGYQITQALTALGSGGVTGSGLGQGHAKLLYLPEAHNDFIFALIGEELGLIGSLIVVTLFMIFIVQGWRVARRAPDMLGTLIALGVTLCAGLQAAINIAVVTHLDAITAGIALPFISYGGSSLIFLMAPSAC
jgi:cell division protein FtsW